jgi:hypothetical protein
MIYSQIRDSVLILSNERITTVDYIKKNIFDYVNEKEYLNIVTEEKVIYFNKLFYTKELLSDRILEYSDNGIFKVGCHISHHSNYLLIFSKSGYKILDFDNLVNVIYEVLYYLEEIKSPDDKVKEYINKILLIYNENESTIIRVVK